MVTFNLCILKVFGDNFIESFVTIFIDRGHMLYVWMYHHCSLFHTASTLATSTGLCHDDQLINHPRNLRIDKSPLQWSRFLWTQKEESDLLGSLSGVSTPCSHLPHHSYHQEHSHSWNYARNFVYSNGSWIYHNYCLVKSDKTLVRDVNDDEKQQRKITRHGGIPWASISFHSIPHSTNTFYSRSTSSL